MSLPDQATRPLEPAGPAPGREAALGWLLGILAGLLGLGPWLITGSQLPLQNLWGTEVLPEQMPVSLLPLSQYELTALVVLLTTGGAAAGLAVRIWNPARRRLVTWCAAAGVLAVQFTAAVQSFTVLDGGLTDGTMAGLYFAGLLGGVIACIAASLVAFVLLASRRRALVALGAGLMAVPLTSWAMEWVVGSVGQTNIPVLVPSVARWVPAILVGCALAWCGLRPARRAVVWLADLALLWVVPALFISVNYVLGTRALAGDLKEMLLMSRQILAATLGPDGGALPTVLLALAIAMAGLGIRSVAARRRPGNPSVNEAGPQSGDQAGTQASPTP
ncbi:hypothetical protein [Arthrobacter sp. NPDC056493]|uniref:hypothetical protein n=1 Tax=Arthrobacter sp. NPDC056493 TaxID=3345839 RepID=UPI00366AF210